MVSDPRDISKYNVELVLILVLMEDGLGRKISYLSDNLRISQRKTRYFQCFAQKK